MINNILIVTFILFASYFSLCGCLSWKKMKCASDSVREVPEGKVPNIARFSWLGVVQHSFQLGGKTRFAVTSGILIHPGYVIASAEDIARIMPDQIKNNTKFVVWKGENDKFALDVNDYVLHPEYHEQVTFATIALVELLNWRSAHIPAPVLPLCMPVKGGGIFENLYTVKMTDDNNEIQKEVVKMNYVIDTKCQEYYYNAKLTYKKMTPTRTLCGVSERMSKACVWDAGSALITRQNWGYWTLLGFGVRGPGCGAPSRYVNMHHYMSWIDEVLFRKPLEETEGLTGIGLRTLSPYKLLMYSADVKIPTDYGQCDRNKRGTVIYKDNAELLMNKNFGQGFYFLALTDLAHFKCATINIESQSRTITAVWVEHNCHRENTATSLPIANWMNRDKMECFMYYKTTAFVEFRFFFSFRALLELTVFGSTDEPRARNVPNPFHQTETTDPWEPTDVYFKWKWFFPYYFWSYHL